MAEQVTIRVRPGELIRFPTACVACGQPARERLKLQKRRGQITRRVEAPLCAGCARQLARRSGEEERMLRLGWPVAIAVGLLLAVLLSIALPLNPWPARLAAGAIAGVMAGALVRWVMVRRAEAAELPGKRVVRAAAQIVDFTWRDMTLEFTNVDIAGQVRQINATTVPATAEVAAEPSPAPPAEQTTI